VTSGKIEVIAIPRLKSAAAQAAYPAKLPSGFVIGVKAGIRGNSKRRRAGLQYARAGKLPAASHPADEACARLKSGN